MRSQAREESTYAQDYERATTARSAHKGTEIEDLKKARWLLDRQIARLEAANG